MARRSSSTATGIVGRVQIDQVTPGANEVVILPGDEAVHVIVDSGGGTGGSADVSMLALEEDGNLQAISERIGPATGTPASTTVAEDTTARTLIELTKAIKNLLVLFNNKFVPGNDIGDVTIDGEVTTYPASIGQDNMAGSMPVVIASDQTAIPVTTTLAAGTNNIGDVDIASALPAGTNNIGDVDLASAIPAGANLIGKVGIDQVTANANEVVVKSITAGDSNIGNVDIASALPAGTNNIGDVDLASAIPAGNNNIGDVDIASALPAGTNLLGKVGIDQVTANANEVVVKSGTVTAVTSITNALPAGTNAIGKLASNTGVDIGDVDILSIAAGDNNIGNVDLASSIPAGTNNIGDVDVLSIAAGNNNIGDVDIASFPSAQIGQKAMAASVSVTIASDQGSIGSVALSATDNAVLDAILAVLGATTDAKVIADAVGTIHQYLRGMVTMMADTSASAVSVATGADVTEGSTTDAAASSSVAEDTTARTINAILKAVKNILILINAKLVAGTTIGATQDAGPAQTVSRLYTTSSDMTTAAAITAAPTSGQKIVAMDILASNLSAVAMNVDIEMETSANVLAKVPLAVGASQQISLRGFLKGDTADKKLYGKASAAGAVSFTVVYFSEA